VVACYGQSFLFVSVHTALLLNHEVNSWINEKYGCKPF
jgi:hypothetical protein